MIIKSSVLDRDGGAKVVEKSGRVAKDRGPGIRHRQSPVVTGSHIQPHSASSSHIQLPEMGSGMQLRATYPHAPGTKMT